MRGNALVTRRRSALETSEVEGSIVCRLVTAECPSKGWRLCDASLTRLSEAASCRAAYYALCRPERLSPVYTADTTVSYVHAARHGRYRRAVSGTPSWGPLASAWLASCKETEPPEFVKL